MKNQKRSAHLGIILFISMILVNAAGAFGWINNTTQREVSDQFPTLITPAPFAFSIWSVIYLFLLLSSIILIKQASNRPGGHSIAALYCLSSILNIAWIVAFSFKAMLLSTLLILALTIVVVRIVHLLRNEDRGSRVILPLAFGLYSGWLTIATVVNTASWLVSTNWNGFGLSEVTWAGIMLSVAFFLALAILFVTRNASYPLPLAWAYMAIYLTQRAQPQPPIAALPQLSLATLALIGAILFVLVSLLVFWQNGSSLYPNRNGAAIEEGQS